MTCIHYNDDICLGGAAVFSACSMTENPAGLRRTAVVAAHSQCWPPAEAAVVAAGRWCRVAVQGELVAAVPVVLSVAVAGTFPLVA